MFNLINMESTRLGSTMKNSRFVTLIFSMIFTLSSTAFAQDTAEPAAKDKEPPRKSEISEILDSMGYPELQVVPRASERLAIEAKSEDSTALITHWPVMFSGLVTAAVGISTRSALRTDLTDKEKSDSSMISNVTVAMGLGWVVGAGILGARRPYRAALNANNKYPGKDERSTLLRERLAEEALEKPAKTMATLETFSVISLATVNVASAWHANETGKITAGVGLLFSFLPYVFEDHSVDVYEKHIEYKKKIYAPLKTTAYYHYESRTKTGNPMTGLTWEF
jgi:hypothetical protein